MLTIYADPITVNCRKVLAGMKMMDIGYTLDKVDYFQGEQKSDAYLAINPNAALPSMRDGDLTLWESNSILAYAADKNGKSTFYPTDPTARADVNRWLFWEAAHWFPSCYVFLVENCVKPLLGAETDPAVLEAESANFHKLASILDERLSRQDWLCGGSPTIADVSVASAMHLHDWQKLPLENHGPLVRWMTERVEQQPWWRETTVLEGFALPETEAA